jgi:hypothetical protein
MDWNASSLQVDEDPEAIRSAVNWVKHASGLQLDEDLEVSADLLSYLWLLFSGSGMLTDSKLKRI